MASFFKRYSFILFAILFISENLLARSGPPAGGAKRGGLGFLFQDFSGFANPAQKAHFRGFATEIQYETILNTGNKTVTPSVVWGKNTFGLGAFASRSGSDLSSTDASTDSIGGAFGLGLAANRITMGAGYTRSIDTQQNMDGVLNVSANYNGLGGKGFHLGGAVSTTVNRATRDIKTGTVAMGWSFGRTALEAIYSVNDFQDPSENSEISGFFTWEGDSFFLGAGGGYDKFLAAGFGAGRLGVKLGNLDLTIFGNKSFATGANPSVGGSLRLKF